MTDSISPRQMAALIFVSVLSPFIRRFPRVLAFTAGRSGWLAVIFAGAALGLVIALLHLLSRRLTGPVSLNRIFNRALGPALGGVLTAIYSLWLAFYAGVTLRFFAARFVSTVYTGSQSALFIVVMGLCCAAAGMGTFKAIARSAMVFRLVMTAVLAVIIVLSFSALDFRLLLPVTARDIEPNLLGSAETLNVLSIGVFFAFAGDKLDRGLRPRDYMLWLILGLVLIELACVCCIAMFGPEITASMSFPFFMLARDITILGSVERIEPLVIAVWVLSDFTLVSSFLHLAGAGAKKLLPRSPLSTRSLTAAASVIAIAAALILGRSSESYDLLSKRIVPILNAAFVLALAPLALIAAARCEKS